MRELCTYREKKFTGKCENYLNWKKKKLTPTSKMGQHEKITFNRRELVGSILFYDCKAPTRMREYQNRKIGPS